ncbi:hypothetical protein PQ455_18900 [Sphingomonas naphthae]|uniref:Uncharacterized protein n=1 Tax=Sphingomonas naphthae TaxID=1813468 RepID=A0ABY7TL26_9SPHN|nr:hypothetical protein [Sphingomonas naphthae]WCT73650.1 hypothetical protein PQ455_18900 [Sphingomonas naphthae]
MRGTALGASFGIAAAMIAAVAFSGRPVAASISLSDARLIVSGPADGLRRFVALQGSRNPALPVVPAAADEAGRAQAVVHLPDDFTGRQLINTTREALTAGLSYRVEGRVMGRS